MTRPYAALPAHREAASVPHAEPGRSARSARAALPRSPARAPRLLIPAALVLALAACPAEREEDPAEGVDADRRASFEALGPISPEDSVLLQPGHESFQGTAPDSFLVRFETTRGAFLVQVRREWAPHGADRFYNLVRAGYYDGVRFFRVLEGFVAQFGIHGDPRVAAAWQNARIPDDPVQQSNERGTLTFATAGPDTRTTQVFINLADNPGLDGMGFAPFGEVTEGMDVVDDLYTGYGEGAPRGEGPAQDRIQALGNPWLEREFPRLDHVERARVVDDDGRGEATSPGGEAPRDGPAPGI